MGALFFIRLLPNNATFEPEKYILKGDVKGIEIVHNDKPYTLNFEQQNTLIDYLNQSLPVNTNFRIDPNLPFSKIIIYRFKGAPLELTPITLVGTDLVFSAPTWNPNGYLRDISVGRMNKLLNNTFDH